MKLSVSWFLAVASAAPLLAGTVPIGIVSTVTSYSLNNITHRDAQSIAEGATVATTTAPSDIRLDNGAEIRLATRSTGTVYNDHLVLNQGAVRVGDFTDYSVQFRNLQVTGDSPGAQVIVRAQGNTVEVASLGGSVRVSDGGEMMTRVGAGTKTTFQAKSSSSSSQTGAAPDNYGEERNTLLWTVVAVSGAAMLIGGIAAYQGKSPW